MIFFTSFYSRNEIAEILNPDFSKLALCFCDKHLSPITNRMQINIEKSISEKRLSVSRTRLEKITHTIDIITWSALCLLFILSAILFQFRFNSNKSIFLFAIFSIIILFGIYGIYRKFFDDNLTVISTSFSSYKTKKYLIEFLQQNNYEVFKENKNIIVANIVADSSINNLWLKTVTFIIDDEKIYFSMVKNYPKINPPVFFSHLFLKKDLQKFFKNK